MLADCFNIASGLVIAQGTRLKSLELITTNEDTEADATGRVHHRGVCLEFVEVLNRFRDLEILIISAMGPENLSQYCDGLEDAIELQNGTLKILLVRYGCTHTIEIPPHHICLIDAIKTCQKLSQLCVEFDPIFMVQEFKDLIQALPGLELLYLFYPHFLRHDWEADHVIRNVRGLLEGAPLTSKLSMLCFQEKWCWMELSPGPVIDRSDCFVRPAVRDGMSETKERPITEANTRLARYLVSQFGVVRRLEPWLGKDLEPNIWFEA